MVEASTTLEKLREQVLYFAAHNINYGEIGKNNCGPFIRAIGGRDGDEWCALFAGYCWRRAYEDLSLRKPSWLYRVGDVPEKGARRLTNNLARAVTPYGLGFETKNVNLVLPGDLVCWNRGTLGWTAHVAIVERIDLHGIVHTIEGNVGRYPARVKRLAHDVSKERLYKFAGLR